LKVGAGAETNSFGSTTLPVAFIFLYVYFLSIMRCLKKVFVGRWEGSGSVKKSDRSGTLENIVYDIQEKILQCA
jgi:hypothetical protein